MEGFTAFSVRLDCARPLPGFICVLDGRSAALGRHSELGAARPRWDPTGSSAARGLAVDCFGGAVLALQYRIDAQTLTPGPRASGLWSFLIQ